MYMAIGVPVGSILAIKYYCIPVGHCPLDLPLECVAAPQTILHLRELSLSKTPGGVGRSPGELLSQMADHGQTSSASPPFPPC